MKSLLLSVSIFFLVVGQAHAAIATSSGQVKGLYDEVDPTSTISASPSATPVSRATTYLNTTNTPTSGATENTIILLGLGITFIVIGVKVNERFS